MYVRRVWTNNILVYSLLCYAGFADDTLPCASLDDCESVLLCQVCGRLQVCRASSAFACLQGPGKKWEHYKLTKNGKPLRAPMHVQLGDLVQIIAGAEKGKTGKITNVWSLAFKRTSAIVVKVTVGHGLCRL